jgi:hypothetical protein
MRTIIGVKLSVEGMHYYLDASEKHGLPMKFLEFPHRHMFHIEVRVSVKHDNRDKEFILLKREVIEYLHSKYYQEELNVLDFRKMSCEMIAKDLMFVFHADSVKVSEDDENYALVSLEDGECYCDDDIEYKKEEKLKFPSNIKNVTYVFGRVCSGKTTYVDNLIKHLTSQKLNQKTFIFEIGEVVRILKKQEERIFQGSLDQAIFNFIIKKLESNPEIDTVYIVGIRQKSLFLAFEKFFGPYMINIDRILLNSTTTERRERFDKRNADKDKLLSFTQVELQERKLGLDELILFLIDNYENLKIV